MRDLIRCDICSGILEYELNLMSINLDRKDLVIPKKLALGLNRQFVDIKKINKNNCEISIVTELICFKVNGMKEIDDLQDIDEKQISFKFEIMYNVLLNFDEKINVDLEKEQTNKAIKHYAWFVLYPTLRENINNLANKIGIQNIDIPYKVNGEEDEG